MGGGLASLRDACAFLGYTGGVVALLLNHRLIAGNPPGSGNGDSCLELDFILEDCRSIDAEGGQAPGGEAEGLLQFGDPLFRHVADPDLAGCAGGFHRDHSRLA